jgi:anthranilate phosphoribosyltransferase
MFAPTHHGATRHAVGPRREIGVRSIFNLLGPLTNPAGARWQLVGVYEERWVRPLAESFGNLGSVHTLVVHAEDGLDEISIAAPTTVSEYKDGNIADFTIKPDDFGLTIQSLDSIRVDSAEQSLELIRQALGGNPGPAYDMVMLNAGATLYAADLAPSLAEGIIEARAILDSSAALEKLEEMAAYTQRFDES